MKRGTTAAIASTSVALIIAAVTLSSCGANTQASQVEEKESASISVQQEAVSNTGSVTRIPMEAPKGGADYDILIIETVHNGVPMTCSTKGSARAGVSCIPSVLPSSDDTLEPVVVK